MMLFGEFYSSSTLKINCPLDKAGEGVSAGYLEKMVNVLTGSAGPVTAVTYRATGIKTQRYALLSLVQGAGYCWRT